MSRLFPVGLCSIPASVFILAMNHLYLGQREAGLDIACRSLSQPVHEPVGAAGGSARPEFG